MIFSYLLQRLNALLNYKKADPLYLVRLTTTDLGKIWILRILLKMSLAYNLSLLLIQIVYFSLNFNLPQFIQYFSFNAGSIHGHVAGWICLYYEKDALDLLNYKDSYFTKLTRVKADTHERILRSVIIRRYLFLLNTIFLNMLFVCFWPLFGYEDDYYFPVFFFNEYIKPIFGSYVVYMLRILFYSSTYSYVSTAGMQVHFILYCFSHMEFQLIILEDTIEDIEKTDGRIQQGHVNDNLRACIKHYMHIRECMNQLIEWVFWPMAVIIIGSFVMLLTIVYFVFEQASLEAFPRVTCLAGIGLCFVTIYAMCGQSLANQCERVNSALFYLPWYGFNTKNCKLLNLFMVTTERPFRLTLMGFVDVDATLILKVYKFLFSSLATIQQIVALRHKDG